MKKVVFIFITLLGLQQMWAQKFEKSSNYTVKTEIKNQGVEQPAFVVKLVNSRESSEILTSFIIEDTELFEDIFISTLENPGLEGVSEVIKVEVEYLACCAIVEAHYFIVNHKQELIALPQLKNTYCQGSDTDLQYIFPNQTYGTPNNILKTQTFYTQAAEIKYVNLKQSYNWYENNFKTTATAAVTSN